MNYTSVPLDQKKEIRYGTPVIDGKLDDLYLDSFCYAEEPMKNMNYTQSPDVVEKYMGNTSGKAYYLYDDAYLYICTVVHDETICSRGREWRMNTVWPWNDDGAENYLWFSDEDTFAVHSDAHGIRSVVDEHIRPGSRDSSLTYHDTPAEDWAATIDHEKQNYTVEIRIRLPEYVKGGSVIGTLLEIDDRWAVGSSEVEKLVGAIAEVPSYPSLDKYKVRLAKKTEN